FGVVVRGFYNEGVSFPATAGITVPLADIRTGPATNRDDTGLMNHLHEDHDIPLSLHNLIHVAVATGQHPPRQTPRNTTVPWAHVLKGVSNVCEVIVSSRLRGRGYRYSAVRRFHDKRRLPGNPRCAITPMVRRTNVGASI